MPKHRPTSTKKTCIATKLLAKEMASAPAATASITPICARRKPKRGRLVANRKEATTTDRSLHASSVAACVLVTP